MKTMKLDRVVVLVLLLAAIGCGSNGDPNAGSSQSNGTPDASPTSNTPDSGYAAGNHEFKKAVLDTTGWTAAEREPTVSEPLSPEKLPDDQKSANGQNMTASIDGMAWQATQFTAEKVGGSVAITGLGQDGTAITLNLGAITKPGKVRIISSDAGRYTTYISREAVSFTTLTANGGGGSGTVNVTAIDNEHIVGTYSFTATAQAAEKKEVKIANGSFDVRFR